MDSTTQSLQEQPRPAARSHKKLIWFVILAIIVSAALAVFITLRNSSTSAESNIVNITQAGFNPATIKIRKGEAITWMNKGVEPHQIMADFKVAQGDKVTFDSHEPIGLNETYTFTFDQKGTYTYHDKLNPYTLKGRVIVED